MKIYLIYFHTANTHLICTNIDLCGRGLWFLAWASSPSRSGPWTLDSASRSSSANPSSSWPRISYSPSACVSATSTLLIWYTYFRYLLTFVFLTVVALLVKTISINCEENPLLLLQFNLYI